MYYKYYRGGNDRFFLAPFLLGGLVGAGVTSVTRPRPVFVNPAPIYPSYGPYQPYPFY